MADFDFIIVGAGSAGCVLARRLAPHAKVALVEAGPRHVGNGLRRPSQYLSHFRTIDDWTFATEPQPGLAGRSLHLPRGRGIGGSTRINASIWLRPLPSCLQKICDASSGRLNPQQIWQAIEQVEALIQPESPRWISHATEHFITTCDLKGLAAHAYLRMNRQGRRFISADLCNRFLHAGNLTLVPNCLTSSVVLENERATGVQVWINNSEQILSASQGVILSAGTFQSPAILQRSGIGPRHELNSLGIRCYVDLPGVGSHLRDHLIFPVIFATPSVSTFPHSWNPRELARWQISGTGPVCSNLAEAGAFTFDDQHRMQLIVTPTHYLRHPNAENTASMTIGVVVSHPASCGQLQITSSRAVATPRIDPAFLTDNKDVAQAVVGVNTIRDLAAGQPLADFVAEELFPGSAATSDRLERFIRRFSQTLYHPVGGCVMGPKPAISDTIDGGFQVHGVENLWVADASILPNMPAANPNPLVMALAWIAGDLVLRSA